MKTWRDDRADAGAVSPAGVGTAAAQDITRRHVHEVLDTVAGKGLTIGVNRLQALISRIFTVALDRGLIDAHPAARMIKRFAEQPRRAACSHDDELRALWTRTRRRSPAPRRDAMRLRLLLGQRGGETAGMLWSEVDLDAALWSLPGTRTKNKRPHVVPLPPTALSLLKARRTAVAAGRAARVSRLALTGDAHKALGAIHGGAYKWKDLRRTVATRLAGLGFDETTIGRCPEPCARHGHGEALQPTSLSSTKFGARSTAWDVRAAAHSREQAEEEGRRAADAVMTAARAARAHTPLPDLRAALAPLVDDRQEVLDRLVLVACRHVLPPGRSSDEAPSRDYLRRRRAATRLSRALDELQRALRDAPEDLINALAGAVPYLRSGSLHQWEQDLCVLSDEADSVRRRQRGRRGAPVNQRRRTWKGQPSACSSGPACG